MELMNSLIEQIRKERVVLFLGSGFSLKAGASSASAICEALKSKLTKEEQDSLNGNQLDYVSNEFEQMRDRDTLIQTLKEAFTFTPKDLCNQVALTQIPHFQTIITTNYDTLLEDTYGNGCVMVRSAQDCTDLPNDKVRIYKIHGDFSNTDNLIVTKNDYRKYFAESSDNSLWRLVQSLILTKDVLFIGYSLEDDNVFTILENIQKDTNQHKENIYLISPSVTKSKQKRLEGLNVKYIDSRAEDFLPTLIQSINDNILKDYRKKWVSTETASKYCDLHHIQLTTQVQPTRNRIEKIKATGTTNKVKLQISTLPDIVNAIVQKNFSLFTDVLPSDAPIVGVPALQIPSQEIKQLSYVINGITIFEKDDIKAIYVVPQSETIDTTVRIPVVGFNDNITVHKYSDGQRMHYTMQTEIYQLKATLLTSDIDNSHHDLKFNVTFTDKYKNNTEALKWIGFLIALFGGEKFYVGDREDPAYGKKDSEGVEFFRKREQYYLNISEIEKLTGSVFKEYDNYSEDNYTNSCLIISYLKKEPYVTSTPYGVDFHITIPNYSQRDPELPFNKVTPYTILYPQQDMQQIVLNKKVFTIPYTTSFFKKCWLTSMTERKSEDVATMFFHNEDTEVFLYLSNNPAQLCGNTVQLY